MYAVFLVLKKVFSKVGSNVLFIKQNNNFYLFNSNMLYL